MASIWVEQGHSRSIDASIAAAETMRSLEAPGREAPTVAILYCDVLCDQQAVLNEFKLRLPHTVVIGATSAGFTMRGIYTEDTRFVAAAFLGGKGLHATMAAIDDVATNVYENGRVLAAELGAPPAAPFTCLLWYDPTSGLNVEALLEGLHDGGYTQLHGGGAGQPWGPIIGTHQFAGDRLLSHGAVIVRLDGLSAIGDMTHGMEPIGVELEITRAEGIVLHELNGRPALDVWVDQLGLKLDGFVDTIASWAVGVKHPEFDSYEGLISRAPFGMSEHERTITLQAPIATGTRVQLCTRTLTAVYEGAVAMAARLASSATPTGALLALSFECASRAAPFLGAELAAREARIVQDAIPHVPWLGMYAWGEIAPTAKRTHFHNHTFPVCILYEAASSD